jgi:hypothetical protein
MIRKLKCKTLMTMLVLVNSLENRTIRSHVVIGFTEMRKRSWVRQLSKT